ncbi:hypothetical protein ACFQ3W_14170 [Paenibacillus puldeungensis]|uniref:DUF4025 domain-containing protein n=1 Tax=Paenibacillus puldeungensis TaxID=696536 RepID=A0ABW3RYX3_9BACL
MTRHKGGADKNLSNVVQDLEHSPATSQEAQQLQQSVNDQRHRDAHNHHKKKDMDPTH